MSGLQHISCPKCQETIYVSTPIKEQTLICQFCHEGTFIRMGILVDARSSTKCRQPKGKSGRVALTMIVLTLLMAVTSAFGFLATAPGVTAEKPTQKTNTEVVQPPDSPSDPKSVSDVDPESTKTKLTTLNKSHLFFEAKIRPMLVKHCYRCHSKESGKSRGGLRLDSRAALLKGGDSGAALVPGAPKKSLLLKAIRYNHDDLQMPPKGKLPDDVIADFQRWIAMGAPDPRVAEPQATVRPNIDLSEGRTYWAYKPVRKPKIPTVKNNDWPMADLDAFVLAELERQKLRPVASADAGTLVRRLYFVLTGLPPSPADAQQWTARIGDGKSGLRQAEIAKLADQLLDSPQYGEQWGRHWLDVARFAESTGGDANNILPNAWRYRDYVIDAFNRDKPFDRFIEEQLAGDLLPIANDREWADNVVATGFLAVGVKLVAEDDDRKFFADLVDEQIDVTSRAFLATTVACARCHDHKFDPIPQEDYYALAGIFRSTQTHYGLIKAQARQITPLLDLSGLGLPTDRPAISPAQLAKLKAERDAANEHMDDILKKIRAKVHVQRSVLLRARTVRDRTEMAWQRYTADGNARVFAMGTQDRDHPLDTWLLVRGDLDKPAQKIQRGFLQVLSPPKQHLLPGSTKGSGRRELARWIASANNPLTARVMANRVWHHLFGRGIVRTVDDFGKSGSPPSHPLLLDFLAVRLVEHNWSIKSLIREIVLSRTWQLSSTHDHFNHSHDPENRYLWRMSPRRLQAESIRDAMMAVSGNLTKLRPTGTFLASVGEGTIGRAVYEPQIRKIESNHRSVYLPRVRNVLPESLELFDAPDGSLVTGNRETTTNPLQALYLMNNPFVQKQADGLAKRISEQPNDERVQHAYLCLFGRLPTVAERQHAETFAKNFRQLAIREGYRANEIDDAWLSAYGHALLCTAEFSILD